MLNRTKFASSNRLIDSGPDLDQRHTPLVAGRSRQSGVGRDGTITCGGATGVTVGAGTGAGRGRWVQEPSNNNPAAAMHITKPRSKG